MLRHLLFVLGWENGENIYVDVFCRCSNVDLLLGLWTRFEAVHIFPRRAISMEEEGGCEGA